ncbi:DNA topoisomerase IB [Microbacterium imperiale]|uniref:DNA topoisomerase n=1 Tax=Microbacterium imperiale TaxID=33884 RepID=A0A9W6M3U7_9MICO|nr:DNA topoisomerase IB [Microbacterium imperiale]MBP2421185.1 DNA topoisomerase IB [Microbacterium imperiale]MDS0199703.1 DNA topoisomerase IB [Microbacterium imperiale]BFE41525.1 DNA topoisomerase IB [Microbacterium imperiale]GLJ80475.1 DNA topoisomerase [Microbacterium imperiale]
MPRLVRVRPGVDPGIRRIRSGKGFRYTDADGGAISRRDLARIRTIVIPPAWQDVWISENPQGHVQVVGTDDAGRRQYIYHPDWTRSRDKGKYARAMELAEALPRARSRATTSLRRAELDRERVLAAAFRMLDRSALRIGSQRYLLQHGSRGLTTLRRRDASVADTIVNLAFSGKSGQRQALEISDPDLAAAILLLIEGRPASPLLAWQRERRRVPLTPNEVNAYVRALTGGPFTAKDFRTLRGTVVAADALARIGIAETARAIHQAEVEAVRAASTALGNTPSVARSSYIDPRVFERYRSGMLLDTNVSPESAIRSLILG